MRSHNPLYHDPSPRAPHHKPCHSRPIAKTKSKEKSGLKGQRDGNCNEEAWARQRDFQRHRKLRRFTRRHEPGRRRRGHEGVGEAFKIVGSWETDFKDNRMVEDLRVFRSEVGISRGAVRSFMYILGGNPGWGVTKTVCGGRCRFTRRR